MRLVSRHSLLTVTQLKEQECRNVVWISECIAQKHKAKIDNYINIF